MTDHLHMLELALSQPVAPPAPVRPAATQIRLATVPLATLASAVAVILIAFAGGYGYHRDELYFLAAGQHLAWAYPDQGVLTPLIAHVMSALAPGSLTALRSPSALLAAGTVFLTGAMAYELGGRRRAQVVACGCAAVSSVVLAVGHLLSTTTFDLFAWTAACWLVLRIVRTGHDRLWVAVGALGGCALLNKPLIAAFFAALLLAMLGLGPRERLRSGWLLGGAAIAVALWLPWLVWQPAHGWPQLHISSAIANGGSASSQPRWAFLPYQLLLVSPVLAPVWIAGLIDLLRRNELRPFRALGVAWLILAAGFVIAGGKPYYLAGLFPVLLAAGSLRVTDWMAAGRRRRRTALVAASVGLSGLVSAVIALPILPAHDAGPIVSVNADVGETIGWPELVLGVQRAYRSVGGRAVIFTANYGEAGAIDRYGPALGLPAAYSGHNGFADWGPPADRDQTTIVVGLSVKHLQRWFSVCVPAGRVRNSAGINNQEEDAPIDLCSAPRAPWSSVWPRLRHLS
jgi:4-amino-4-deoxy-L-arabinose transferase-like glycosyltransferase